MARENKLITIKFKDDKTETFEALNFKLEDKAYAVLTESEILIFPYENIKVISVERKNRKDE